MAASATTTSDLAVFTLYVIGDRPQSSDITNLRRHGLSATLVIPHLSNGFVQFLGRRWDEAVETGPAISTATTSAPFAAVFNRDSAADTSCCTCNQRNLPESEVPRLGRTGPARARFRNRLAVEHTRLNIGSRLGCCGCGNSGSLAGEDHGRSYECSI
jgi:hypothetical protein